MLFGNCRDDFEEKMQKLGTEEKEELKKAVEEAGLLAKEENNSQENNSQENCNQIKNRMQSH